MQKREKKAMKNKKDSAQETLVVEITAWALIMGIIYLFTKMFF